MHSILHRDIIYVDEFLQLLKSKLTIEGGIAVRLTNKTGANSVKGTVVVADNAVDNSFDFSIADEVQPIGVLYEDGIADGEEVFVVVVGIADVLLEDGTASTRGNWVRTSENDAGRADATNAAPPGGGIPELDIHMAEIGHCLESQSSGTDVLAKCVLHFN